MRGRRSPVFGALLLAACSESSAPACATQISEEVCATAAQPRGAEPLQGSAQSSVGVQLPPAPLADGRYVLVALDYACPEGQVLPRPSVQGVLELSGCVLRRTLFGEGQQAARVDVFELHSADQGMLELQRRCPALEAEAVQAAYGFDGARLELGRLQVVGEAPDETACDTLETWELR